MAARSPHDNRIVLPTALFLSATEGRNGGCTAAVRMSSMRRCHALGIAVWLVLVTGCDAVLVELGRGQIAPVVVERTFPTGFGPYEGCPDVRLEYGGDGASSGAITIAPLSRACLMNVRMEDAVLLSQSTMELWHEQLKAYDMQALVSIDVVVDDVVVDGGRHVPLGPEEVRAISIALDDRVMLDLDDIEAIERDEADEIRIPVPQTLVERFVVALTERKAFTSRLELRLLLRDEVPIPRLLHVRALLQPILLVDGWNATF